MSVLVLNASYEPLNIVSSRRAVLLLLKGKAQLLEAADVVWRSERARIIVPLVIRLLNFVRRPLQRALPVTRRGILARDGNLCQYCGRLPGSHSLTIDHIVPKSRGGSKSWSNLVAACAACNRRKGGRLPEEAGMRLARKPIQPRPIALPLLEQSRWHGTWAKYMQGF